MQARIVGNRHRILLGLDRPLVRVADLDRPRSVRVLRVRVESQKDCALVAIAVPLLFEIWEHTEVFVLEVNEALREAGIPLGPRQPCKTRWLEPHWNSLRDSMVALPASVRYRDSFPRMVTRFV